MLEEALKIFKKAPLFNIEETAMVGDRIYDVKGAAFFGMDCIGAGYGFAPEGELEAAGAVCVIKKPQELLSFIN